MVVELICRDCGNVYRSDEGEQSTVRGFELVYYTQPPYNYNPGNGYCLGCWICPGWNEGERPADEVMRK
jgi:hypothetical protein